MAAWNYDSNLGLFVDCAKICPDTSDPDGYCRRYCPGLRGTTTASTTVNLVPSRGNLDGLTPNAQRLDTTSTNNSHSQTYLEIVAPVVIGFIVVFIIISIAVFVYKKYKQRCNRRRSSQNNDTEDGMIELQPFKENLPHPDISLTITENCKDKEDRQDVIPLGGVEQESPDVKAVLTPTVQTVLITEI